MGFPSSNYLIAAPKDLALQAVLILDDFWPRELSEPTQADLYELFSEPYERFPTILTSNRDFAEWPCILVRTKQQGNARKRLLVSE